MNPVRNKTFWVAIFSIAMANLEAAVGVYLRRMYGIHDLMLQIPPFDPQMAAIELGRELATLIMLLSVGWIAGRKLQSRLGFSFLTFGLWDIFYYIWLCIFIGWPQSLLETDILFLLPLPWWGPVLSPVLIAVLMVIGGILAAVKEQQGIILNPRPLDWTCLVVGVLVMLYTFMADALHALPADTLTLSRLRPGPFNWPVYLVGFGFTVIFLLRMARAGKSSDHHSQV